MANIPKKVIDRFIRTIPKFQKVLQIAKDRDVNEADTVSVLNDIFGDVFGYDKYLEVTSEFAVRSTYCDLAIKVEDKVQFLVEAKAIGIELKETHMRQAIDYGANHGIPWVVLTNGIDWRIYRIRFEQPINFDLVSTFDFAVLNPRDEKDQSCLFILAKEGLNKNVREDFYEKVQSVNRYVIGTLVLGEPVLNVLRRELKKMSEGVRIDVSEVEYILRKEVLKREVVEGDEAEAAQARINKFYRKSTSRRTRKRDQKEPSNKHKEESVTERLLREAGGQEKTQPTDAPNSE
jgi:predicted type IV restriction endonuclease